MGDIINKTPLWAERGDTFFTHSHSWLGRLIRWGETDPGETPAWTNHTGVIVESGWIVPPVPGAKLAVVVEALWHTRRGPLDVAKDVEVRVFRPVPEYTEEERLRLVTEASRYVGDRYGWWKLLGFLAKKVTRINVPALFFVKDRPICSFLAGLANDAARPVGFALPGGRKWPGFGCLPQACDPDTMMDFCETHPTIWQEVK